MSKHENKSVPKSLIYHSKNTISMFSKQWLTVTLLWAFVIVIVSGIIINFVHNRICLILLLCVLIVWIMLWVKLFRSEAVITRTILTVKYYLRKDAGMTYLPKFTMQPKVIEKYFPVLHVHEGGVIEYTQNRFGVLMDMDTPRVDKNNLDTHLHGITSTLNSLNPGDVFKTFACSRLVTQKPILSDILDSTNDPDKSQTQRDHLYSMYDQLTDEKEQNDVVHWHSSASLSFNNSVKSIEDARIVSQNTIPGLTKIIKKSGVRLYPLEDPTDITMTYYQTIMQKEVKI